MSTIKLIFVRLGTATGVAILIAIGVFAYQIKGELHDSRVQQATADSVRWTGLIDGLVGRLSLLDQNAAATRTVFVQARAAQGTKPVVTGGGPKADSIANAAVNACFEKATAALSACEVARKTADSLPAMKDSLTAARIKLQGLRSPPRWTANGGVFYTWPMQKPMVRAETEFKVPLLPIKATAGADYLISIGAPATSLDSAIKKHPWRAYLGASIPFR